MFQHFSHESNKVTTCNRAMKASSHYSVLRPEQLFEATNVAPLIDKIRTLLPISADCPGNFSSLCLSAINNYARFVQQLPSNPSGQPLLIQIALQRTIHALENYHQFLFNEIRTTLSNKETLWMYVVFSAALFFHIGSDVQRFHITLYSFADADSGMPWQPFAGYIDSQGLYYDYQFQQNHTSLISDKTTPLFARQLMPNTGFNWIAKNPDTLAIWLALLAEEWQQVGSFAGIIPQALHETIREYFEQLRADKYQPNPTIDVDNRSNPDENAANKQVAQEKSQRDKLFNAQSGGNYDRQEAQKSQFAGRINDAYFSSTFADTSSKQKNPHYILAFMYWLANGIGTKLFALNTPESKIYSVSVDGKDYLAIKFSLLGEFIQSSKLNLSIQDLTTIAIEQNIIAKDAHGKPQFNLRTNAQGNQALINNVMLLESTAAANILYDSQGKPNFPRIPATTTGFNTLIDLSNSPNAHHDNQASIKPHKP